MKLRPLALLFAFVAAGIARSAEPLPGLPCLWSAEKNADSPDTHVAFRGTFTLAVAGEVEFRLLGASWFVVWLDGKFFTEGPARFALAHPEYQLHHARLTAGRHVLAVQVHHEGVATRMLGSMPPFLWCEARVADASLALAWKSAPLPGYATGVRRLNPQLGWAEWCDTRKNPTDWQLPAFDDDAWPAPAAVTRELGSPAPLSSGNTRSVIHTPAPLASGALAEAFGYERDNPSARFFLRDLAPAEVPAQGVWRRYDLGRVRLMRPRFTLDLPAGAIVEFAYAESLAHGRVTPWVTLSAGDSCHLDHFVARGGPQEFFPLTPRGGRFAEVHVLAPPAAVKFLREEWVERAYYGEPEGAFSCDDPLLNRIWAVGVETHRACAEDALMDNPTRERGQWAGDVVTVGMDIAGAAFDDLRLCRRGLIQCAQSARADGLVAGMCPGQNVFLSTYAAQWVSACVHYWELTGDRALLAELFGAAEKNIAAFEVQRTADGLDGKLGWGFVDWGYVRNPGPTDMAVNLHYLAALRDMGRWCAALNNTAAAARYAALADPLAATIARYFAAERASGGDVWARIGYHRTVLGLRLGFFSGADERAAVAAIKAHMLSCFPNDPAAPRLSDPSASNPRLITPYFAHFAMPELIARGETDFVLGQFRTCWGWALGGGRTTWLEVFDPRWSHCHQWAGCPTWQLSRWVLGLRARSDLGERHYAFSPAPGSLTRAEGKFPLPGRTDAIRISWTRTGNTLHCRIASPTPIFLHMATRVAEIADESEFDFTLPPET